MPSAYYDYCSTPSATTTSCAKLASLAPVTLPPCDLEVTLGPTLADDRLPRYERARQAPHGRTAGDGQASRRALAGAQLICAICTARTVGAACECLPDYGRFTRPCGYDGCKTCHPLEFTRAEMVGYGSRVRSVIAGALASDGSALGDKIAAAVLALDLPELP